jgi:hypothetical protein
MENVNITATTKTESSLEYNDPNVKYSPGNTFFVNEVWDIWIDGELEATYIEHLEIKSVNVEYVVNENEWYVSYNVAYKNGDRELTDISLDNEDIDEVI